MPLEVWLALACLPPLLGVWLWQLRSRDYSAIDIAWCVCTGGVALTLLANGDGDPARRLLVGGAIAWWAGRLIVHLLARWRHHQEEDGRYAELRAAKNARWNAWALLFTAAQWIFVMLFCLVPWVIADDPRPFGTIADYLGVLLWAGGQLIECVADAQLAAWRADPESRGKTCRRGLWRYSRHPNYFGELVQWIGLAALATPGAWCWLAWAQVLAVYLLIRFMTGVPYAERQALRSRGEDYRRYQAETSALIPWFPQRTHP